MATKKIFTVFDSKTEVYGAPFLMISKGEALRGFVDVANDPSTSIGKYPADFTLFEIGEYDDSNACFTLYDAKVNLGSANEFKKS